MVHVFTTDGFPQRHIMLSNSCNIKPEIARRLREQIYHQRHRRMRYHIEGLYPKYYKGALNYLVKFYHLVYIEEWNRYCKTIFSPTCNQFL